MSTSGRRMIVTVALAVLIVAIPVAVYALGRESPAFHVQRIVVTGQRKAHTHQVRQALNSAFLGANLFSISVGKVRSALAEFPYVDGVSVDRRFPDTLRVRLTEYVPVALLFSRGRWYVLSSEGRVLAEGSGSPPPTSPTSSAPAGPVSPGAASPGPAGSSSPSPGGATSSSPTPTSGPTALPSPGPEVGLPAGARRLPVVTADLPAAVGGTVTDQHVRDALAALVALPARLRRTAASARATDTSIRLTLAAGPVIEVGDTGDLGVKMLALRAVLARYAARHTTCTFVDVSVPDRPIAAPLLPVASATGRPSTQGP